jgi:hypothetical protein
VLETTPGKIVGVDLAQQLKALHEAFRQADNQVKILTTYVFSWRGDSHDLIRVSYKDGTYVGEVSQDGSGYVFPELAAAARKWAGWS